MCLFNKVLPLDSTPVSGTRELRLCPGVKPLHSTDLAEVCFIKPPACYYIQQKSLQSESSLQQVIIILLIGLNVFWNLKLSGGLCSLCLPVQGRWTCVSGGRGLWAPSSEARPSILPVQLPEASHLSVPDLTRAERKRDHWQEGDFFFFPPPFFFSLLARLTECLPPLRLTEESNYSLGLNLATFRRQPTDIRSRLQEQSVDQSVDEHFSHLLRKNCQTFIGFSGLTVNIFRLFLFKINWD